MNKMKKVNKVSNESNKNIGIINSVQLLNLIVWTLLFSSWVNANSIPEPQRLMEETSKAMLGKFVEQADAIKKDPTIAHQLIDNHLVPNINFSLMSRWVLGKSWKKVSKEQQQQFIIEFKDLVIKFYSKALIDFMKKNEINENIITFKPFRGELKGRYATIRSQVNPPNGGKSVEVNYSLYQSKKSKLWKVYDVSIEGISLVTTYRSSFKNIIKEKGMDGLLLELKDKNSTLAITDTHS